MQSIYYPDNYRKIIIISLLILILLEILWLIAIVAAPVIVDIPGFAGKAGIIIYGFFSPLCHQSADRCFFIDGNKFAVCSRCFGIYTGFLVGTVLYPLFYRKNFLKMPGLFLLAFAAFILALDVALDWFGFFKNTFLSRSVTGGFIGIITAFFIIPGLLIFVLEIYKYIKDYNK
ncbi:MAG: DUF2085 domain-containing protein [Ignavibacteria bacterium]|nr:DUF2085 domain-containing protein [Ignavibacteria bacterium]